MSEMNQMSENIKSDDDSSEYCPYCSNLIEPNMGYYCDANELLFCCEDCAHVWNEETLWKFDDLDYLDPRDFDENGEPRD